MNQSELHSFLNTGKTLKSDGGVEQDMNNTVSDTGQMTVSELDRRLFDCADHLRGNVSKEKYKNYISPLLFLYSFNTKYEQIQDENNIPEKTEDRNRYLKGKLGYIPPEEPSFTDIQTVNENIAGTIDNWFTEFETLNGVDLLDKPYSNEESLTDEVLREVLTELNAIEFQNTPADLIGESYMNLMKRFAHEEGGEYFTPPRYSNLLARTLYTLDDGFEPGSVFHDPTVGSAGLLIESATVIRDDPDNRQDSDVESVNELMSSYQFTGQELDPQIYKLGLMNTSLHGMPGSDLRRGDSLGNPLFTTDHQEEDDGYEYDDTGLAQFDYIVANPPFSQTWPKDKYKDGDQYKRFDWHSKLPRKNRADYSFLMHMLAHANENGMVATVVPHGVLYRSGEQRYRDYLLDNDYVEAVISLPGKLFESTSAPTAILIMNKDKPEEHKDEVLFVNADVEDRFYYDTGSSRNELIKDGIDDICEILAEWRDEERVSRAVSTEEISEFDNNLTLSLYVDTTEPQPEIDLDEVQARHDELLNDCVQLNEQIKTQINNLEL